MSVDSDTRADRRERYHKVLRIVEYHTRPESPLISKTSVKQVASQAGVPKQKLDSVIQAAIDNDDLIEWESRIACTDEESLLAIVEHYGSLIGECNAHLQVARGGDD